MSEHPCIDACVTYAMCKQRQNFEKFKICQQYADYIVLSIANNQSSFDEEFGKGVKTVVGVTDGGRYIIDKKGIPIMSVKLATEGLLESNTNP